MRGRMLILLLTGAAVSACGEQPAGPAGSPAGAVARAAPADTLGGADLDVRLDALAAARPRRVAESRNPFRFGEPIDAVSAGAAADAATRTPLAQAARPGGRAPASDGRASEAGSRAGPARLRFIAIVDAPRSAGMIAVLSDGESVFQGRVGDTIDGRYRIMSIGSDTTELELLQTGERQVLDLDGT